MFFILQSVDRTVSCIPANTGLQRLKSTKYANQNQLVLHSHFLFSCSLTNEKLIHYSLGKSQLRCRKQLEDILPPIW